MLQLCYARQALGGPSTTEKYGQAVAIIEECAQTRNKRTSHRDTCEHEHTKQATLVDCSALSLLSESSTKTISSFCGDHLLWKNLCCTWYPSSLVNAHRYCIAYTSVVDRSHKPFHPPGPRNRESVTVGPFAQLQDNSWINRTAHCKHNRFYSHKSVQPWDLSPSFRTVRG